MQPLHAAKETAACEREAHLPLFAELPQEEHVGRLGPCGCSNGLLAANSLQGLPGAHEICQRTGEACIT